MHCGGVSVIGASCSVFCSGVSGIGVSGSSYDSAILLGSVGQLLVSLLAMEGVVFRLRLFRVFRCFWFLCLLVEKCFCLFLVLWWDMVFFFTSFLISVCDLGRPAWLWGQVEPAFPVGEGVRSIVSPSLQSVSS